MHKVLIASVKVPENLERDLLQSMLDHGYNLKGKSKWVREAIEAFLEMPNFSELVELADEMDHFSKPLSVRLTMDLGKQLDKALITVRTVYPGMEGVRSNIIRASIVQRLLHER